MDFLEMVATVVQNSARHSLKWVILGLDHQRLTFRHNSRDFRLTDVHGRVVHELIA